MAMSKIKIARSIGERRLCYSAEYNGACYDLKITAHPSIVECVTVCDVARDEATAKRLCTLLADNCVFPISVYEVLDDLLGDDFFI